ncbi:uncharacterized protein LOC131219413 isoform X6 [Magnolia sinica]|uniref:uncharacterized protein LOC131219413 isoform X6 n=1 Tax=Magnolia sinica TaxID=86752 RepID=UPI00265B5F19|nr:uncharacterized protein LOC131219413 isoform X6 [Magnolia sinica]
MERSKGEMPSDDLEITSIGALYGGGPWEKKYWNCSRGKDRYPYPIGYHAVRTHAGNMYRMEIHEGPNGPLFVITSTEGDSCTGQTPDIAWEHFQKRNGPRVKTWHAKRFSCKIDGVELFGFRNPHVQRLLRELAANVNGTAERSSIHPNFCNGASSLEQEIRSPESCTYPDLLPYLGKRQSTGKRSRKQKKIAKSSISGANLKRFRSQELLNDAMVGIARKVNRGNRVDNHPTLLERSTESEIPNHHLTYSKKESVVTVNGEIPYFAGVEHHSDGKYMTLTSSTFDENCMVHEELGNISKLDPTAVAERGKDAILVKGDLFLESPKLSNRFVKEPILSQEHSKLVGAEVSCCVAGELAAGPNMGSNIDKEQKMHVSERGSPPDVKSVIPDSFEDEQCACDVINLRTLHHDLGKAGPALLDKKARDPDISRFLGDADGVKESSNCHFGNGSKDEILLDEAAMLLNDPPENDTILVSVAPFSCTSPSRHNLLEGENNKHKNWDGSTIFTEINPEVESSKDKGIKIISDGIEGIATSGTVAVVDGISRYSCCEFVCKHEVPDVPADKPTYCPGFRSNKTGFSTEFEHAAILPSSSSKSLGTANIEIGETSSHFRHSSPGTDFQRINIQCDPANSDTHRLPTTTDNQDANFDTSRLSTTTDARTVNFVGGVGTIPEMQIDDNTAATGTGNSFFGIHKTDAAASTGDYTVSSHHVGKLPCSLRPSLKYSGPHSESIVFRNIENNSIPETNSTMNTLHTTEIGQATAADGSINKLPSFAHEIKLERQHHNMNISEPEGMLFNTAPHVTQNQALVVPATDESGFGLSIQDVERHQRDTVNKLVASYKPTECSNAASCMQGRISPDNNGTDVRENLASSDLPCYGKSVNNECEGPFSRSEINQKNVLQDDFFPKETKPCNEFGGFVELVGCYVHPMPILSVLLSMKDDIIHICVLCGPLGEQRRTLFIYDVPAKALSEKCPSFLGYASIMLPLSKGTFNKDIAFERSGLQFTPDGQCLVLLNSIKVPCCREQNIDCLCSVCTSDCCEENAVKVVHVQLGCVSVVVKLTTAESICCVLVYEPCYLVVAEESGRLHVWIMNSTWSAWVEEFTLPSFDYLCPSLLELRRIPKCASLFVGHNGIGGFGLWDISKRVLLSSFSSPGISIFQVLPVGLFGWQMNCPISTSSKVEEHIKEIIAATESWFSRVDENYDYLLPNGEDIAVWLLVSAASNSEAQYDCPGNDLNATPVGWWRLALLVKNTVIMGSILDPRASAAVASAGHGIIGTCDGLVYMWELSTGKKLANLKSLNGGVSCIATDANSGALAVAGNECQLLLYIQSPKHLQC